MNTGCQINRFLCYSPQRVIGEGRLPWDPLPFGRPALPVTAAASRMAPKCSCLEQSFCHHLALFLSARNTRRAWPGGLACGLSCSLIRWAGAAGGAWTALFLHLGSWLIQGVSLRWSSLSFLSAWSPLCNQTTYRMAQSSR